MHNYIIHVYQRDPWSLLGPLANNVTRTTEMFSTWDEAEAKVRELLAYDNGLEYAVSGVI
jgi:hypothetical protein